MEPQIARLCMLLASSQELSQIRQGTRTSTSYATEVLTRWEELQSYLPPTTDQEEARRREEQNLVYTYLGGLDSTYEALRSQILLSHSLPDIDAVIAIIQHEETRRATMGTIGSQENTEHTYLSQNRDTARARGGPANTERCNHYQWQGHTQERCWLLHP
eukprot:XP_015578062.1 uncharacterized protein LOC107261673 [Ricinus communis]